MNLFKTITQNYNLSRNLLKLMNKLTNGINFCSKIALEMDISLRNSLLKESYKLLKELDKPLYYYLEIINKAIGW